MEFTEAQQKVIDSLINKRVAEVKSKAEALASEQMAEVEKKHQEAVQTLKAENEKFKTSQGESNERTRKALLKAEIAQTSAVKTDQVMKLTSEGVIIGDDGELKVVDEKGVVRLDAGWQAAFSEGIP